MTKTLNFKAASGGLRFEIEKNNWCRVTLLIEGKEIVLGADSLEIIQERTLGALKCDDKRKSKIQLEGRDVVCAVSLFEAHASIFVSVEFPKTLYFLYDGKGLELFDKLTLNDDEYRQLVELLES